MSYSRSKKFFLSLGLMIFFVMFLSFTNNPSIAQAKDTSSQEITTSLPEIKLNVKSKELVKGKSYRLKVYNTTNAQTIIFKSSDTSIVTVSDNGTVKGVELGSATVYVTVKEGSKVVANLQSEITVGVPAVSIRLTQDNIVLAMGQKTTLRVLVMPYNTVEDARFISIDSDVVSISTGGRITAKSVGNTYVYAKIDNGWCKCRVTVIDDTAYNFLTESGVTDLSSIADDLEAILVNIASGASIQTTTGSALDVNTNKSDNSTNITK